ncbi:MAG: ATP-binding protein [Chloroflexi bacterium]|nr:ATP-binding protein [Chloroflexota bacterium]
MSSVVLQTPGKPEYARVARLAVAGTASCAGFSVEDIHEIRQAVGEACSNAVTASQGNGGIVTVTCDIEDDRMIIQVSPVGFEPADIQDDERTSFQYLLISTLMDDVEIENPSSGRRAIKMTRSISR